MKYPDHTLKQGGDIRTYFLWGIWALTCLYSLKYAVLVCDFQPASTEDTLTQ